MPSVEFIFIRYTVLSNHTFAHAYKHLLSCQELTFFYLYLILAGSKPVQASELPPVATDKRQLYAERYGEKGSDILKLETQLQLEFDRYCDSNKPSYWPSIPLNVHHFLKK